MDIPIILTAFGTATSARTTYSAIEADVRACFPAHPLYWGYTSKVLRHKLRREHNLLLQSPAEIIQQLSAAGCRQAVIQSLHLFAGSEYHKLQRSLFGISSVTCSLGPPLLDSSEDYDQLATMFAPLMTTRPGQAILIVAHGTNHPVWRTYLTLEASLQARFGKRLFLGTIEHYPQTDTLEEEIAAKGYASVLMIPLFLVAGRHYHQDMMGAGENSWKSRLERQGLEVEAVDKGLGLLPGFDRLITNHIRKALSAF